MDNITHTVIGLVVGDALHNATNPRRLASVERRRLFLISSAIANNIPDIDVFFTRTLPQPLGSLLIHRGYTHTLFFALPQALIVVALLLLLRGPILSRKLKLTDWTWALVTATLGVCLHTFADSWNSYGVHPFSPFDNHVYYGDFTSIIEPFLWAAMGAWLLLELPFAWRLIYFSLFSFFVGYGFNLNLINENHILILVIFLVVNTLLMGLLVPTQRSLLAIATGAIVLGFLNIQSVAAKAIVLESNTQLKRPVPLDISATPTPANPFCWSMITASLENNNLVIRKAYVSVWNSRISGENCLFSGGGKIKPKRHIAWTQEFKTPLVDFVRAGTDCFFKDWLKFARFPFLKGEEAKDIRNFVGRPSFLFLKLQPGRECLSQVPPWIPPRSLLPSDANEVR